jgi:hypothetical protein
MCIHKSLLVIAGAAVIGVLVTASAHAWTNNTNYLTFNGPVALPGVTLPAGTYAFRTPSGIDKSVVQVMNRAETTSYYLGITRPVSRPRAGTELLVTMGEAPAHQVAPIQAWFPLGEFEGHAFIYAR